MHHYFRYTDKGTSIAGRVIRAIGNLIMKLVFEKGKVERLSELPIVTKTSIITIRHSILMELINASKKPMKNGLLYSSRQEKKTWTKY